ncbi:MAG: hypothetical protein SVX43_18755 [Cyanobacteriota bacterium]|nr:hypothetical protein [Cyanobacteriota bacterium]
MPLQNYSVHCYQESVLDAEQLLRVEAVLLFWLGFEDLDSEEEA